MTVLVTGAGGFIGGHLAADLLAQGLQVRAVDKKPVEEWYQVHADAENVVADCSDMGDAHKMAVGTQAIYNLAADMGGMGFIENNRSSWRRRETRQGDCTKKCKHLLAPRAQMLTGLQVVTPEVNYLEERTWTITLHWT